jgi:hypothetical protein
LDIGGLLVDVLLCDPVQRIVKIIDGVGRAGLEPDLVVGGVVANELVAAVGIVDLTETIELVVIIVERVALAVGERRQQPDGRVVDLGLARDRAEVDRDRRVERAADTVDGLPRLRRGVVGVARRQIETTGIVGGAQQVKVGGIVAVFLDPPLGIGRRRIETGPLLGVQREERQRSGSRVSRTSCDVGSGNVALSANSPVFKKSIPTSHAYVRLLGLIVSGR